MKNFLVVFMNNSGTPTVAFFSTEMDAISAARNHFKASFNKAYIYNTIDGNNPRMIFWQ